MVFYLQIALIISLFSMSMGLLLFCFIYSFVFSHISPINTNSLCHLISCFKFFPLLHTCITKLICLLKKPGHLWNVSYSGLSPAVFFEICSSISCISHIIKSIQIQKKSTKEKHYCASQNVSIIKDKGRLNNCYRLKNAIESWKLGMMSFIFL